MMEPNQAIWVPTTDDLQNSSMARFRDAASSKYCREFPSYHDLHSWSVDPKTAGDFWMLLFNFLGMSESVPPTKAFEPHSGNMFPSLEWFPNARFNFAGSILAKAKLDPNKTALIEAKEGSLETISITWGELYNRVEKRADAMKSLGVTQGDRIAAVIANNEHAITLCLATLSLGAIWSSISPDFGPSGILDRILQIKPKLIFADSATVYNGKHHDLFPTIRAWAIVVAKEDQNLVNLIFTPADRPDPPSTLAAIPKAMGHGAFLSLGKGRPLDFQQTPFNHPAFIFYSSGTTGSPKCILHSAGGVLLQVRKDYELHIGLIPEDILFQYTTTAWIMWAFVLSALGTGSAVVLFTGSPTYPDLGFLPKLISKLKVSVLGTSAKYLTDLKDSGRKPREEVNLSFLRKVSSTGSVLPKDVATWFYEKGFPKKVQLISGSGGTDCSCAFVCGTPLLPLYGDEIQCKVLGMAIDVFDDQGRPIKTDEPGELVCKQPFPSQPVTFWGHEGGRKYEQAYFSLFGPKVWVQGDLIRVNIETGGIQMLGRSDGVLNPSGVRFGSAEIYNAVRHFSQIDDTVCVGQRRPQDRDEIVLLFVKLKAGHKKTLLLKDELKEEIRLKLTKRHVPKYVFYVEDIPYSIVGKKLEILVKNIVCGRKVNSNVVANPESLKIYEKFFQLESAALEEGQFLAKL